MSAVRSEFEPWAADRFGDLDLKACGETCLIENYPAGIERAWPMLRPGRGFTPVR